jgi:GT2 family glycosyltransferase
MNVAILILSWNAPQAALSCVHHVTQQRRAPDHVLVVDNGSEDDTIERVARHFSDIEIIRNSRNLGFGSGMNVGIRALQAKSSPPDIVVLLNQDTEVDPDWLEAIIAPFEDPKVGAVGSKIRYPNGALQHAGVTIEWPRAVVHHVGGQGQEQGDGDDDGDGNYDEQRTYDAVTGAAIALRLSTLEEVGLFDPEYSPAYYEDIDLCWRIRQANYQIIYAPNATLIHHESLSIRESHIRSSYYNRGRLRFVLKSYPFDVLLGSFFEAELQFIRRHGHKAEERALRWAYIDTMGHLPDILRAREAFHQPLSRADADRLHAMLLSFKHAVAQSSYRRAHSLIGAFYPA